jgi:hypothetical protein
MLLKVDLLTDIGEFKVKLYIRNGTKIIVENLSECELSQNLK